MNFEAIHLPHYQNYVSKAATDATRHPYWVNTLAMLEFTGAEKIGKVLTVDNSNLDNLKHWSDEVRHAYLLRKLGEEMLPDFDETARLQHWEAGKNYFQGLDHQVSEQITEMIGEYHPILCYAIVSHIIELRAMEAYPIYQDAALESRTQRVVGSIIDDEAGHLKYLQEYLMVKLKNTPLLAHFKDFLHIEADLFGKMISEISEITIH